MKIVSEGNRAAIHPGWDEVIKDEPIIKARCMVCGTFYEATLDEYRYNSKDNISIESCHSCSYPHCVIFYPDYLDEAIQ
jgi:uncharacterized Zn finger protein